jgi:hypothetical protein
MGRLFSPINFLHHIGRLKTTLLEVIFFLGLLDDKVGLDFVFTTCLTEVTCFDEEPLLHEQAILYIIINNK